MKKSIRIKLDKLRTFSIGLRFGYIMENLPEGIDKIGSEGLSITQAVHVLYAGLAAANPDITSIDDVMDICDELTGDEISKALTAVNDLIVEASEPAQPKTRRSRSKK